MLALELAVELVDARPAMGVAGGAFLAAAGTWSVLMSE